MLDKSLPFNCAVNLWQQGLCTGTRSGPWLGILLHSHPYLCQQLLVLPAADIKPVGGGIRRGELFSSLFFF